MAKKDMVVEERPEVADAERHEQPVDGFEASAPVPDRLEGERVPNVELGKAGDPLEDLEKKAHELAEEVVRRDEELAERARVLNEEAQEVWAKMPEGTEPPAKRAREIRARENLIPGSGNVNTFDEQVKAAGGEGGIPSSTKEEVEEEGARRRSR